VVALHTTNGRWDSSIAIANDGRTVYYGYAEQGDDRPMILKGTLDKSDPALPTIVWDVPATDVGAPAGLQNVVFSAVVAGDPDRAALIFHGTTTAGNSGDMDTFPADAEWYLWVATTFDGGINWQLRNATPDDPTQKGSICDQGTTCANAPTIATCSTSWTPTSTARAASWSATPTAASTPVAGALTRSAPAAPSRARAQIRAARRLRSRADRRAGEPSLRGTRSPGASP
jgi:hypothetical protein